MTTWRVPRSRGRPIVQLVALRVGTGQVNISGPLLDVDCYSVVVPLKTRDLRLNVAARGSESGVARAHP
jgi:hypothetical protein